MPTQENIEALRDVCSADAEILKLRKTREQLAGELLELEASSQKTDAEVEARRQALEACESEVRSFDESIEAQKAKIADLEEKVIEQQTPQAYQALASLADQARRKLETVEKDREAAEVARDTARIAYDEAASRQTQRLKESAKVVSAKQREIKKAEASILDVKKRRDDIASKLDPQLLAKYEFACRHVSGLGLTFMTSGGACGGCHMKLRPQVRMMVASGVLAECPTCHRLICDASKMPSRPVSFDSAAEPILRQHGKADAEKAVAPDTEKD